MTNRRTYKDEPYLRSEHLLKDGKYQSVIVEIADVVFNCPGKKGEKDKMMKGLAFVGTDKVLGLNVTNESLVCLQTGHGNPEKWIGHKVQLVARLIANKKLKVDEPAIRIWPSKPIPNGRIRDQMGKEIKDDWYGTEKPKEHTEEQQ
jgi:hypothetical protein